MAMWSNLDVVRRIPWCFNLNQLRATMVADAVSTHRFQRGEALVTQGEPSGELAIMLDGRARLLWTDSQGREVTLAYLEAGARVGEMSLVDDHPHSVSVVAESQTNAFMVGREAFVRCLADSVPMVQTIMKGLMQRLGKADETMESLALLDVYGRVARAFMALGHVSEDGGCVTQRRVSRQDVAKMIGASREMDSRVTIDCGLHGFITT